MEKDCRVEYETEIFGRQAGYYGFGGREGKRGVDYFRGLLRTDKKEFSFRGIESKIGRRHPDEMRVILTEGYGRREICRNKTYEELCVVSI